LKFGVPENAGTAAEAPKENEGGSPNPGGLLPKGVAEVAGVCVNDPKLDSADVVATVGMLNRDFGASGAPKAKGGAEVTGVGATIGAAAKAKDLGVSLLLKGYAGGGADAPNDVKDAAGAAGAAAGVADAPKVKRPGAAADEADDVGAPKTKGEDDVDDEVVTVDVVEGFPKEKAAAAAAGAAALNDVVDAGAPNPPKSDVSSDVFLAADGSSDVELLPNTNGELLDDGSSSNLGPVRNEKAGDEVEGMISSAFLMMDAGFGASSGAEMTGVDVNDPKLGAVRPTGAAAGVFSLTGSISEPKDVVLGSVAVPKEKAGASFLAAGSKLVPPKVGFLSSTGAAAPNEKAGASFLASTGAAAPNEKAGASFLGTSTGAAPKEKAGASLVATGSKLVTLFFGSTGTPKEKPAEGVESFLAAGSKLAPKENPFSAVSSGFLISASSLTFSEVWTPNLKPDEAVTVLLGSTEAPNLNPADAASAGVGLGSTEAPNLNPAEVVTVVLGSTEAPNLNPADAAAAGVGLGSTEAPNLNPAAGVGLGSTEAPNLNPPVASSFFSTGFTSAGTPNLNAAPSVFLS